MPGRSNFQSPNLGKQGLLNHQLSCDARQLNVDIDTAESIHVDTSNMFERTRSDAHNSPENALL